MSIVFPKFQQKWFRISITFLDVVEFFYILFQINCKSDVETTWCSVAGSVKGKVTSQNINAIEDFFCLLSQMWTRWSSIAHWISHVYRVNTLFTCDHSLRFTHGYNMENRHALVISAIWWKVNLFKKKRTWNYDCNQQMTAEGHS